jgi:hypothetical protein
LSFPHYSFTKKYSEKILGILPTFANGENQTHVESKVAMYISTLTAGLFGANFYEFIFRVMGSEVLRAIVSFVIRSALTRVGL